MVHETSLPNHVVAQYRTHDQAEGAIRFLTNAGHDITRLSLVGQDTPMDERLVKPKLSTESARTTRISVAEQMPTWDYLSGSAMIYVPGIGAVKFGGWLVDTLEHALQGQCMTALEDTLAAVGIPNARFARYRKSLKAGRSLLFVHGTESEARRAKWTLPHTAATEIDAYYLKYPTMKERFIFDEGGIPSSSSL